MTKLISGIPPLGKPVLYTIGLCFVSLFLIYSMDVSNRSWLSRDIIDQVKYKEVKWTEPSFRSVYLQCLGRLQVKIQLMIVTTWPHTSHGIQTMIDSCLRFTYFQPVSIFVFS